MRHLSKVSVLTLVLLCLIIAPALAERVPVVKALTDVNVQSINGGPAAVPGAPAVPPGCSVGNLNPPAQAISGWAFAPESYYLNFDPALSCTVCSIGFQVTQIHWVLQSDGPCEIDMEVGLFGADVSDPACAVPGPLACISNAFTVTLPAAGLWDIALPLDCACADPNYLYSLGVNVYEYRCDTGTNPAIITDVFPTSCTSWNDYGFGLVDLVGDVGFPGNLIMWADAVCCEPPVGADESSWGKVKGLYGKE